MNIQHLVQAFNNLPRQKKTPSGLADNHWHLAIRHVPIEPAGDLLHIVNPHSRFTQCEGPAQIMSISDVSAQAKFIVPMLLKSFVNGLKSGDPRDPGIPVPFAPWSWGIENEPLARALEAELKSVGVIEGLCILRVGDKESNDIEREVWSQCVGALMKLMGQNAAAKKATIVDDEVNSLDQLACSSCERSPSKNGCTLFVCSRCKSERYCSRDCQKKDWRIHKRICIDNNGSITDAFEYYNRVAPTTNEAQALAQEIGLTLPNPNTEAREGLVNPLKRLVITGKDTPENISIMVGAKNKNAVSKIHHEERIGALLNAPEGSPMHKMHSYLDQDCPSWNPRPASASELEYIQQIKRVQRHLS